jgi:hypothetical protein
VITFGTPTMPQAAGTSTPATATEESRRRARFSRIGPAPGSARLGERDRGGDQKKCWRRAMVATSSVRLMQEWFAEPASPMLQVLPGSDRTASTPRIAACRIVNASSLSWSVRSCRAVAVRGCSAASHCAAGALVAATVAVIERMRLATACVCLVGCSLDLVPIPSGPLAGGPTESSSSGSAGAGGTSSGNCFSEPTDAASCSPGALPGCSYSRCSSGACTSCTCEAIDGGANWNCDGGDS